MRNCGAAGAHLTESRKVAKSAPWSSTSKSAQRKRARKGQRARHCAQSRTHNAVAGFRMGAANDGGAHGQGAWQSTVACYPALLAER